MFSASCARKDYARGAVVVHEFVLRAKNDLAAHFPFRERGSILRSTLHPLTTQHIKYELADISSRTHCIPQHRTYYIISKALSLSRPTLLSAMMRMTLFLATLIATASCAPVSLNSLENVVSTLEIRANLAVDVVPTESLAVNAAAQKLGGKDWVCLRIVYVIHT